MDKNSCFKDRVTFLQKIALITLGATLVFVMIEIGMRLAGFTMLLLQERRNLASIRQRGEYRILCIGESTTQNEYPPFLEEILNQRKLGIKFSVIDKGIAGIITSFILSRIELYLDRYRPDMVIAMMGINDEGKHIVYESPSSSRAVLFLRSLRTYKLARLLWLHMITKAKEIGLYKTHQDIQSIQTRQSIFAKEIENAYNENVLKKAIELNPQNYRAYVDLAWLYRRQDRFSPAQEYIKKAIELNPQNYRAYLELGRLYRRQHKFSQAEEWFKRAIELNPREDHSYFELGRVYHEQDKFSQAEEWFKRAIELNPRETGFYFELGRLYHEQDKFSQAEECFKKCLTLDPMSERLYGALSSLYEEIGKHAQAQEYYSKAKKLGLGKYNYITIQNYRKLKEILDKEGVIFVCVQYPMLNIGPLKKIFNDQTGIIFVDNEKVFKEAVRRERCKAYFRDMFGGEFGHCTSKGNRLLAENIANIILKEVFGK
jgi:tetratricopeptide (TPR) repeat protein